MRFDIITIFPKIFEGFLTETLIARGQKKNIIKINIHNLRDDAPGAHKSVDDRPFGGGAGMVFKIEPIFKTVVNLLNNNRSKKGLQTHGREFAVLRVSDKFEVASRGLKVKDKKTKIILLSAKGKQFNQAMARKLSKLDRLIFICGRYEGVDERVAKYIADEEVSIGEYVLTGGEIPAMAIIEAVSRLLPGFLGKKDSLLEESFSFSRKKITVSGGKSTTVQTEYPHYTRPEVFSPDGLIKWCVPRVLISGNHKKIKEWRESMQK